MAGPLGHLFAGAHLDDLPQVHDGDAVAHVLDNGQVVGDEQVGEAQPLLKVLEQVDDLGLDRDVQSGDRFVADEHGGLGGQRPCHTDALALPAGELGRETVVVLRVEPDQLHQFLNPPAAALLVAYAVDSQRVA